MIDVSTRTSLTVFGATGFTARFVIRTIVEQAQTISREDDAAFTWSIAGRNRGSLEDIVDSLKGKVEERFLPSVILGDVKDQSSLQRMAEGTRLVMNCVGPYAFLGEPVIKAVLSGNEALRSAEASPTDYIDLSGEPAWIEEMVLRYQERASRLGCSIIHAAAFDSVPSDLGLLFLKQQLIRKGAIPTSAEAFVRLRADPKAGMGIHYATYQAAVNGFSTRKQLGAVREELYRKLPKVKPRPVEQGLSSGLPARKGKLGGLINYAEEQGVYVIPFFFADPSVVRLGQSLDAHHSIGVPAVQFAFWIVIPTLPLLLLVISALTLFGLMASFSVGRSLLLKYPRIFSAGMVSHDGPTQEQLDGSSFTTTMIGRGYSERALKDRSREPDVKCIIRVSGPEVGYVSTPIIFVQVARTILRERERVVKGTLTPATALGKTTLVDKLNEEGNVTFTVVQ